jgi:hypothetical protein
MRNGGGVDQQRRTQVTKCRQERSGIKINPGGQDQQDSASTARWPG